MLEKDYSVFKKLVKAYYKGDFEKTVQQMIEKDYKSEDEAKKHLQVLCGVVVDDEGENLGNHLIEAITKHQVQENIIQKIGDCENDCELKNGKSKCQSVCPFDAIVKDTFNHRYIDYDRCIHCGACIEVCEKNCYLETTQFLPLAEILKQPNKVIAIVAPAIIGQFGEDTTLEQLRQAFIKIGFTDMIEVAFAADILTLKEAAEFNERVNEKGDFLITSCCCPMWVGMIKKVYTQFIKDVSPTVSPMIAAARILKKLDPSVKVVFIGPCMAKKAEAKEKDLIGAVDYVLTFEELQLIFEALSIVPKDLEGMPTIEYSSRCGRLYARTGGVTEAVKSTIESLYPKKIPMFEATQGNGIKECKEIMNKLRNNNLQASFIEGMGCVGGCVGGPKRIIPTEQGSEIVNTFAQQSIIKIPEYSYILKEILKQLEIYEPLYEGDTIELLERDF